MKVYTIKIKIKATATTASPHIHMLHLLNKNKSLKSDSFKSPFKLSIFWSMISSSEDYRSFRFNCVNSKHMYLYCGINDV